MSGAEVTWKKCRTKDGKVRTGGSAVRQPRGAAANVKRLSLHADHTNAIAHVISGRSTLSRDSGDSGDDDGDDPPPPLGPSESEIGLQLPAPASRRGAILQQPTRLVVSGGAPSLAKAAPPSPFEYDDDHPPPPPAPSESDMAIVLPSRAAVVAAAAVAVSARRAALPSGAARLHQPPPPSYVDEYDDDNPPPPPAPSESDMALVLPVRRAAPVQLNGSGRVPAAARPPAPVDDRPPPPPGAPLSPQVSRGPRREAIAAARSAAAAAAAAAPPAATLSPPAPPAAVISSPVRGPRRLVRREGHMVNHLDVAVAESRRSASDTSSRVSASASDPPPPPPPSSADGDGDVLAALDEVATSDAPRLAGAAKDRARGAGNRRRPTRKGRAASSAADTGMQVSDDAPEMIVIDVAAAAAGPGVGGPRNKALDRTKSGRRASFHIKSDGKASDMPAEGVSRAPSIKRLSAEIAPAALAAVLAATPAAQPAPPTDGAGRAIGRVARGPLSRGPATRGAGGELGNSGRRAPPAAAPLLQQPPPPSTAVTAAPAVEVAAPARGPRGPAVAVPKIVAAPVVAVAAAAPVAAAPVSPRDWTPGSGLPKWKLCRTKEGRVYYFDRETKKSVWVRPDDFDGDEKGAVPPATTTTTTTTTTTATTTASGLNSSGRKSTVTTTPPPAASPPPAAPTSLNNSGRKAIGAVPQKSVSPPPATSGGANLNSSGRKPTNAVAPTATATAAALNGSGRKAAAGAYSGPLAGEASKHSDHKEDLRVHEWYHGAISAQQAFELLKENAVSTFLVRTSSREGCFTISWVQSATTVVHTILTHDERGWHIETRGEEREWPSIAAMLHDYRGTMAIPLKRRE